MISTTASQDKGRIDWLNLGFVDKPMDIKINNK